MPHIVHIHRHKPLSEDTNLQFHLNLMNTNKYIINKLIHKKQVFNQAFCAINNKMQLS